MANLDAPFGLWPKENLAGTTPAIHEWDVSATCTHAIGQGAVVRVLTSGTVTNLTSSLSTTIIGVAAHLVAATGTGRKLAVFDSPDQLFESQLDDGSATGIANIVGLNYKLINFTLNATTGRSITELDASGADTTNTTGLRAVKVIGISRNIDRDDVTAANCGVIVQFNPKNHFYAKDAGVGV